MEVDARQLLQFYEIPFDPSLLSLNSPLTHAQREERLVALADACSRTLSEMRAWMRRVDADCTTLEAALQQLRAAQFRADVESTRRAIAPTSVKIERSSP